MWLFSLIVVLCHFEFSITWSRAAILTTNEPCVPLKECPHLSELMKNRRYHYGTLNILNILHCHYRDRKAYVKCISSEKMQSFMNKSDLLPGPDICGLDILQSKISNGEVCEIDEFPWIALLRYRTRNGDLVYGCHGNLINKRYVLTAAHCVQPDETQNKIGNLYSAILGEYDIRNKTDCVYHKFGKDCADEVKEHLIDTYRLHPDYNTQLKLNDIALLRLKDEVEFSDFIKPICLPLFSTNLPTNTTWWVGGWGQTENYTMNNIKVKAKFALKEENQCRTNVNLTKTHLCAASTEDSKTCPGDSGGPLMLKLKSPDDIRIFLIVILPCRGLWLEDLCSNVLGSLILSVEVSDVSLLFKSSAIEDKGITFNLVVNFDGRQKMSLFCHYLFPNVT